MKRQAKMLAAAAMTLALGTVLVLGGVGCSGDKSSNSGGNGDNDPSDGYLIEVYVGDASVQGGAISAYVGRIDDGDASAKGCVLTVNGTTIPLLPLASTDDDAVFMKLGFGYEAGTTYTVVATLAGRTATCSFVAPAYEWPEITSPPDESGFVAGEPIAMAWHYGGADPDKVYLGVAGSGDEPLLQQEFVGSVKTHSIPGSVTAAWSNEQDLLVTVDLGEKVWPFTGTLAVIGSFAGTVLPGDAIMLHRNGGTSGATWTVTVTPEASSLDADGTSTMLVWARVEDELGNPAADGTTVTFSVQPSGYATVDPASGATAGGLVSTTLRAGTQSGSLGIYASALGEEGYASITLTAPPTPFEVVVGTGAHPTISWTPADPFFGLVVRQEGLTIGNMRWGFVATSLNGFPPPVTYGTVPANCQQVYPFTGSAQALVPGTSYRLGLVDAAGDTTFVSFTP